MIPEPFARFSDGDILNEIERASLHSAGARIAFRAMKAAERQATALESIAGNLMKLANPPLAFMAEDEARAQRAYEDKASVARSPGSLTEAAVEEVVHEPGAPARKRRRPETAAPEGE